SSRRRHTRFSRDWSSDVCSSDLSVVLREISRDQASQYFPPMLLEDETYGEGTKLTVGGTGWGGRASMQIYVDKGVVIAYATNTRPSDNNGPGIDFDRIAAAFSSAE